MQSKQPEIDLAKRLKQLRKERGISIREAAQQMQLGAPSTLSNWESENMPTHNPRIPDVRKLARFYGVNPAWLVGWSPWRDENSAQLEYAEIKLSEWMLPGGAEITLTPANITAYSNAWLAEQGLNLHQLAETLAPDDTMAPEIHAGDDLLIDTRVKQIEKPDLYALWAGDRLYIRYAQPAPTGYQIRTLNPEDKDTVTAADFSEHYDVIGRIHRVGHTRR